MRVIFLDFDGVLHPSGASAKSCLPFEWIDALAALLTDHPEVGVVVHSSWRTSFALDDIKEFLKALGMRPIALAEQGAKVQAIQAYLDAHPDIHDFIVLDDQADEFMSADWEDHLLVCDGATGIAHPDIQHRLAAWLGG